MAGTVRPAEKSLKMDTILPVAPAAMAHLDALALYPDAPIVAVHWMDAGFSSTEEIDGRDLPKGYRAGCPDCTVGLFVGVEDGCVKTVIRSQNLRSVIASVDDYLMNLGIAEEICSYALH